MAVKVVNMIPKSLSGETNQDSEPNLAVNPANPNQIVGTAFTPNPTGGSFAPLFVSSDGGNTWALNAIVPGASASGNPTFDITMKFATASGVLYGGIIRADNTTMAIVRTANYLAASPMTVLLSRAPVGSSIDDQPWVQAATASSVAGSPDRVYVASNDLITTPKTAHMDQSMNAATAAPPAGFSAAGISVPSRSPGAGQNAPSVRHTIHSSGRIYVAYFNWTAFNSATSNVTSDIVVARDDNWGQGATPYTAITDTGDGKAGVRVAKGVTIPWRNSHFIGQERVGSHLSIAVDPNNADTVYVAWCDTVSPYSIHLRKSTDGGKTWSGDLRLIASAINPALAVNSASHVGFLYQTLTTNGTRWETHFELSKNAFASAPVPTVLANTPSATPTATFLPYLGDYIYLTAVGTTFYGIFSANNTPDNANFPNGVTYQRNANFTTHQLLNVDNHTPVAVSIDPFFFTVTDPTILPIIPILPIKVIQPIQTILPIKTITPIQTIKPIEPIEPVLPTNPVKPEKPEK